MNTVASRIKLARKYFELTQEQFGRRAGVTKPAVSAWERGLSKPEYSALASLFDELGINPKWIINGPPEDMVTVVHNQSQLDRFSSDSSHVNTHPIHHDWRGNPLISSVQAGQWGDILDNFEPGDAEDWIPRHRKGSQHTFCLRVEGDSMTSMIPGARSYPHGTIIYVDPDQPVENGKRCVAKLIDVDKAVFKIYAEDMGKKYLKSINTSYPPLEINSNCQIVGKVIGTYTEE